MFRPLAAFEPPFLPFAPHPGALCPLAFPNVEASACPRAPRPGCTLGARRNAAATCPLPCPDLLETQPEPPPWGTLLPFVTSILFQVHGAGASLSPTAVNPWAGGARNPKKNGWGCEQDGQTATAGCAPSAPWLANWARPTDSGLGRRRIAGTLGPRATPLYGGSTGFYQAPAVSPAHRSR